MDELEQMVQLVTDRLMKKLHASDQPTVAFIGEETEEIGRFYHEKGYQNVTGYSFLSPDILVVTELPLFSLTRLAQLIPQNEAEEAMLQQLMQKQTLYIVEEGMELSRRRSLLPSKMTAEFDKAKTVLHKWGVMFVSQTYFQNEKATPQSQLTESSTKRELVTIAKVQALSLSRGDVFYITPNMIVTALAKDYLKDQEIIIEKKVR